MKLNIGRKDRLLRVIAGSVLLTLFFINGDAPLRYVSLAGLWLVATGVLAFCPFYLAMGHSTCPEDRSDRDKSWIH